MKKRLKKLKGWFKVYMPTWLKTYWHCLTRIHRILPPWKEDHRMCEYGNISDPTRNFCSCGYLNGGKTYDKFTERFN